MIPYEFTYAVAGLAVGTFALAIAILILASKKSKSARR